MRKSTDLLTGIERARYLATPATVADLARQYAASDVTVRRSSVTYLRVLTAQLRQKLSYTRDLTKPQALEALGAIHETYYTAITDAVVTPEIAHKESLGKEEAHRRAIARNARTSFARGSKYLLSLYLRLGGDYRKLDPMKITKPWILDAVVDLPGYSKGRPSPDHSVTAKRISKLVDAIKLVAKRSKPLAISECATAIADLQALLTTLEPKGRRPVAEVVSEYKGNGDAQLQA